MDDALKPVAPEQLGAILDRIGKAGAPAGSPKPPRRAEAVTFETHPL